MNKVLVDPAETQKSLVVLKNELIKRIDENAKDDKRDLFLEQVVYKINSCLFSKYPR